MEIYLNKQYKEGEELNNKIIIKIFVILTTLLFINTSVVLAIEYDLEYDANGNLIEDGKFYYEYDPFNNLNIIKEKPTENVVERRSYDSENNLLYKIEYFDNDETKETYYVDKNYKQIVNSTGTFSIIYYYDGNEVLVVINDTDSRLKIALTDYLGSAVILLNESGSVIEITEYEPGGEIIIGGSLIDKLYTGKELNPKTDLYTIGIREYDPERYQFIQPDKLLADLYNPQSLNRYSYVLNNPYKYTDPNGLWAVQVGIGGMAGSGVGGIVGGGLAISGSYEHGLEIGLYGTSGGGVYVSPGGIRGGAGIMITPSAKSLKDISGGSGYIEVGGGEVGILSGSISKPIKDSGIGPTYGLSASVGGELPEPTPTYGALFLTNTGVLGLYSSKSGPEFKNYPGGQDNNLKRDNKNVEFKDQSQNYLEKMFSSIKNIFTNGAKKE